MSPTYYASIPELFRELNDYTASGGPRGKLQIVSDNPLHLDLNPEVFPFPGLNTQVALANDTRRALLYGVYRTFIHTSIERVFVSAAPLYSDTPTGNFQVVDAYRITLLLDRQTAFAVANEVLGVTHFNELVRTVESNGLVMTDFWSEVWDNAYWSDHFPGLNTFYGKLAEASRDCWRADQIEQNLAAIRQRGEIYNQSR